MSREAQRERRRSSCGRSSRDQSCSSAAASHSCCRCCCCCARDSRFDCTLGGSRARDQGARASRASDQRSADTQRQQTQAPSPAGHHVLSPASVARRTWMHIVAAGLQEEAIVLSHSSEAIVSPSHRHSSSALLREKWRKTLYT